MEKIIEITNLSAGYNDKVIIEDINLQVYKNDFIGIIGPNGGGKTTFLKTLLGLIPIQKGSIKIFDEPPVKANKFIGYVPQTTNFDWQFPINVENIVLSGMLKFKKPFRFFYNKNDINVVNTILEKLGILKFRKTHIFELSGGQRKRVFIARALVTEPEILFLDEPTSDLDPQIEKDLYDLLKLISQDKTILLVSHDIGVISQHINKVCCLNKNMFYHPSGKITKKMLDKTYHCPIDLIAHGTPHRVFEEHN
jgi:zinc transport system ATP-binding protein